MSVLKDKDVSHSKRSLVVDIPRQLETLQEGLRVRKEAHKLQVYWKSSCRQNNIEMQREICEQIDGESAAFWLRVLSHWGLADTKYAGIRLSKTDRSALIFSRALQEPSSVVLTSQAEARLRELLQDLSANAQ